MSMEVLEQQHEEMLREAQLNRLKKKALRADRKRLGTPRWVSTVAWELARALGALRKFFKAAKNAD
jgi:hypothetical protein